MRIHFRRGQARSDEVNLYSDECDGQSQEWYNGDDPNAGRHWVMHPKSRGTMIISEGEGRGEGVGAQVTMTRTMTYNQEDCAGGDPAVMLVPSPEPVDKRKALPGLHTRERKAMRGESESERQRGRVRARTGGKVEKRQAPEPLGWSRMRPSTPDDVTLAGQSTTMDSSDGSIGAPFRSLKPNKPCGGKWGDTSICDAQTEHQRPSSQNPGGSHNLVYSGRCLPFLPFAVTIVWVDKEAFIITTFLNSHAPNSHDDGEIAVEPEMKMTLDSEVGEPLSDGGAGKNSLRSAELPRCPARRRLWDLLDRGSVGTSGPCNSRSLALEVIPRTSSSALRPFFAMEDMGNTGNTQTLTFESFLWSLPSTNPLQIGWHKACASANDRPQVAVHRVADIMRSRMYCPMLPITMRLMLASRPTIRQANAGRCCKSTIQGRDCSEYKPSRRYRCTLVTKLADAKH
ncbi:hypothetical protein M747DRAFT_233488 [Aspergillus niger ATCC 13496]|uniref:Contig An15c0200, genomic contig n=3 Tax=Aspergillus niger TaxID=5061 RepID=A2R5Y1_ASPNC|nr:uncharacterized protein An15g05950 [Aspergillus niger]RDH22249.1 hypothetical protein M747DRAFT_233488 [Aspergillus niger ATCC 13496]CAK42548.1 unnamed protein product [Aspergillus niger]